MWPWKTGHGRQNVIIAALILHCLAPDAESAAPPLAETAVSEKNATPVPESDPAVDPHEDPPSEDDPPSENVDAESVQSESVSAVAPQNPTAVKHRQGSAMISPATMRSVSDAPAVETPSSETEEKKSAFRVSARVMAGFGAMGEYPRGDQLESDCKGECFFEPRVFLKQARVALRLSARRLKLKASFDFADALKDTGERFFVRDAWADVKVTKAFHVRVGRFKRPFSRLENRGVSRLPFTGRGLFNNVAMEKLAWGDRGQGVALLGKYQNEVAGKFSWRLSTANAYDAINGTLPSKGVDGFARVEYEPREWISVGTNGGLKHVSADGRSAYKTAYGVGGDLRLKVKGLYSALEYNRVQDWATADEPWMAGVTGYVSYDIKLRNDIALQPMAFVEYADSDTRFAQSEVLRVNGGFNIVWGKHLRVMPQAVFVRPIGTVGKNRWVASDSYFVMLAIQL